MNLTLEQVELLILESAIERTKEYRERCKRREQAAKMEVFVANDTLMRMDAAAYLKRQRILANIS